MASTIRFANGVWIKHSENKRTVARLLMALLFFIPILRPCYSTGNMLRQGQRIQTFARAGVRVPRVIRCTEEELATEHAGDNLETVVVGNSAAARNVIERAGESLLDLHERGLAHGRPFLRDLAWNGDTIVFLDLEEEPLRVMPVWTAQARDLFLFTLSLTKSGVPDEWIASVLTVYLVERHRDFHNHLRRQWRLLSLITGPLRLVPPSWRGSDLRTLHRCFGLVSESLQRASGATRPAESSRRFIDV